VIKKNSDVLGDKELKGIEGAAYVQGTINNKPTIGTSTVVRNVAVKVGSDWYNYYYEVTVKGVGQISVTGTVWQDEPAISWDAIDRNTFEREAYNAKIGAERDKLKLEAAIYNEAAEKAALANAKAGIGVNRKTKITAEQAALLNDDINEHIQRLTSEISLAKTNAQNAVNNYVNSANNLYTNPLYAADTTPNKPDYVSDALALRNEVYGILGIVSIPAGASLSVSPEYLDIYQGGEFKVNLLKPNGESLNLSNATVSFTINGKNYDRKTDANGQAAITINLGAGSYENIEAKIFTESSEFILNIPVVTVRSSIKTNDLIKYYKDPDKPFLVEVLDGQGRPAIGKEISMNINGVSYKRTTNSEGIARLDINLNPGTYILTVMNYPIPGITHPSSTITVKSLFNETQTNGPDATPYLEKYYKDPDKPFMVTVLDFQGNPVGGREISMNINGVFYTATTNSEGIAKLNINLNPGNYILTTIHKETGLMQSYKVLILTKLKGQDITLNFRDGTNYEVKLINNQGKPISDQIVTINIHGVFYNITTDTNGIAKLTINLNPGNYIATAYHDGYATSNTVKVK
jgi:hypothetical protein